MESGVFERGMVDAGLKTWAVGEIKLVTILVDRVNCCRRFLLSFVKICEMFSCVEIPKVNRYAVFISKFEISQNKCFPDNLIHKT